MKKYLWHMIGVITLITIYLLFFHKQPLFGTYLMFQGHFSHGQYLPDTLILKNDSTYNRVYKNSEGLIVNEQGRFYTMNGEKIIFENFTIVSYPGAHGFNGIYKGKSESALFWIKNSIFGVEFHQSPTGEFDYYSFERQ